MPENNSDRTRPREANQSQSRPRRNFLLIIPAAVFAAITATLSTAALRFLRPPGAQENVDTSANWTPLAPLSELIRAEPQLRTVPVEHTAAWSRTREERAVYVLPGENRQVVSAVCPHEGCEVTWRAEVRDFFCPCHDSRFDAEGTRLSGPANRDLERLPTRVEGGILQIQYRKPVEGSGQSRLDG